MSWLLVALRVTSPEPQFPQGAAGHNGPCPPCLPGGTGMWSVIPCRAGCAPAALRRAPPWGAGGVFHLQAGGRPSGVSCLGRVAPPCPPRPARAHRVWGLPGGLWPGRLALRDDPRRPLPARPGAAPWAAVSSRLLSVLGKVNGRPAAVGHDGCVSGGGPRGGRCQLAPAPRACWGSLCCGGTARCCLAPCQPLPPPPLLRQSVYPAVSRGLGTWGRCLQS